jgi:hypothetical protein
MHCFRTGATCNISRSACISARCLFAHPNAAADKSVLCPIHNAAAQLGESHERKRWLFQWLHACVHVYMNNRDILCLQTNSSQNYFISCISGHFLLKGGIPVLSESHNFAIPEIVFKFDKQTYQMWLILLIKAQSMWFSSYLGNGHAMPCNGHDQYWVRHPDDKLIINYVFVSQDLRRTLK